MLTHLERKVHRTILNDSRTMHLPTLPEYLKVLKYRSLKTESDLTEVISSLEKKGYIRVRDSRIEYIQDEHY